VARQTLDQWIHEALTDPDKDGKCTRIALIHRAGVKEQEIHVVKIGGRQWDAKQLAKTLLGKAENYAAELPGVQTFNLLAFYDDNPQFGAIKPFMVNGETELPGLATEGPTKDGLTQQAMRHSEAIIQMAFRQTNAMCDAMVRMMAETTADNINLRRENREASELVRDAMLKLAEQRDQSAMKRLEFQRATEERKKWLSFGPALINALLGREVFPQSMADTALIDAIAESLSETDIQKLAATGVIKPEVWGPLAQRMAQVLEHKRIAHEQARQAMNGVDPTEEATGGLMTQGEELQ
jgi:hypothetical protein